MLKYRLIFQYLDIDHTNPGVVCSVKSVIMFNKKSFFFAIMKLKQLLRLFTETKKTQTY